MNVLEMTDSELYEIGFKLLTDKLGASEVPRFIRQCRPGKGDYSIDRHKLLAHQPDIDTIVKRILQHLHIPSGGVRSPSSCFSL